MKEELLSAEDLLARMRAGTKEVYEIKMRQLALPVRILSLDEMLDIRNRMMVQNAKVVGDQANLASLVQKETLRFATTIGGQPGILSDRLLGMLSLDEIQFLYAEYTKVTEEVNPSLEAVSPEKFEMLVDAIKKNSVTASDLSLVQLRAVFLAYQDLIQRLVFPTSPTDNGSGTLP
jgi:hypothetical protein